MRLHRETRTLCRLYILFMVAFFLSLLILPSPVAAAPGKQKSFSSPGQAAQALVDAFRNNDQRKLRTILGPGSKKLIFSGDETADKAGRERFVKSWEEQNRLEDASDTKAILHVGKDDWPFPIPLVKKGDRWRFNTREARAEILNRRVGRNELSAIQVCLAYVDAQREYALRDRDSDALLEYAQRFTSEPGKKDGLFWETSEGEEPSPLGPLIAAALKKGYPSGKSGDLPSPYHGYYYRILTSQGKNARGGEYSYLVNGKMIGGFALVAFPAAFGASGIMTFIVSQDGVVYQKNLGKDTARVVDSITSFDPDTTWKKVE